jgi:aspartate racemase
MEDLRGEVLGVVGGLGPLASSEFVSTVYRCARWETEQDAPRLVMVSDPSFPDRTTAFLAGHDDAVLRPLVAVLHGLVELGATRLLICCTTAHHLLPRLPAELRARVVSVPRVIVDRLHHARGRWLVLCTQGTRSFRLLQREPLWEHAEQHAVFPDDEDQETVHRDLIYRIKRMADPAALLPLVRGMVEKYGADGFVVGCSELHLVANRIPAGDPLGCIDPYLDVASSLGSGRPAPAWAGDGILPLLAGVHASV